MGEVEGMLFAVIVALSLTPVMVRFEVDVAVPSSDVRVMNALAVSPAARLSKPLVGPFRTPLSVMVRSAVVPVVAPAATVLVAAEPSRVKEPTTRSAASPPESQN